MLIVQGTLESPLIVCGLSGTLRGVSKRGRDTEWNTNRRMEEIREFCFKNLPPYGYPELSVLSSSCNTAYPLKRHSRFICGLDSGIFLHNICSGRLPFPHRSGGRSGQAPARWK